MTGNVEPLIFGRFVETGLHEYDVNIFTYKLRRLVCRRHPESHTEVCGTRASTTVRLEDSSDRAIRTVVSQVSMRIILDFI